MILPFLSRHHWHIHQHIFEEYAVARGGIVDQHVGDRADELAVLDNRASAQEFGQ